MASLEEYMQEPEQMAGILQVVMLVFLKETGAFL